MYRCPHFSHSIHIASGTGEETYIVVCLNCGHIGPECKTSTAALQEFYNELNKETKMSLPPNECCHPEDRVHTLEDGLGNWSTQCRLCALSGDWYKTPTESKISFRLNALDSKETEMAQAPTYEDGYRKGVENALKPLTEEESFSTVRSASQSYPWVQLADLYKIFDERKKSLLTKKVTMYTGIITSEWSGLPSVLEISDSKAVIDGFLARNPKPLTKAIPIEIEIPL